MSDRYDQLHNTSYLGVSSAYLEDLYETYLKNPDAVDDQWRAHFDALANGQLTHVADTSHHDIKQHFLQLGQQPRALSNLQALSTKQENVDNLISAYRRFGHLNATIDPLGVESASDSRLSLSYHQLSDSDFDEIFLTRGLLSQPQATLKTIFSTLQQYYCQTIGVEYSRISDEQEREWLRYYVEQQLPAMQLSSAIKCSVLRQLISAEGMEKYLESKYPGQKRFSVEGGDAIIPLLDELVSRASEQKVQEMVIGMAHRGRLNVLLNIMGQSPKDLFQEFEGTKELGLTTGDVKYHRGYSRDIQTPHGPMHLSLAFNPSHLEFINAVVMGSVRARQQRDKSTHHLDHAIAILIHGDAAFAGQGIVMETLSMSQTRAYTIGGTIHVILNNQVGFTTSDPQDARSSHYCSDLARMIDAPVFHVNADDVEAVIKVGQLALDYRMRFHKDIVIDLVCYRRHGHQEVDEPRATQPLMYQVIDRHESACQLYAKQLIQQQVVTEAQVKQWQLDYRDCLDQGRQVVETIPEGLSSYYAAKWTRYLDTDWRDAVDTTVPKQTLLALAEKIATVPDHFVLQKNVNMIMKAREKMSQAQIPMDWGFAENLAYASLLNDGYPVRLSGEDSRRGTFFHRHALVWDQKTGESFMPLANLAEYQQQQIQIYDSLLAEAGPMGFEYGYSTADPQALVIWEAQFGDFANGGQVIIDQFMSSGCQKWNRFSGLVLLLPHGNEGMGPEHSSARLERFLQLCAQDNMQVFVPTTPAQIFHLLRRQVLRPYRKPLIIMSPKSLLRHKLAVSSFEQLSQQQLQVLIPEIDALDDKKVHKIILCSGKIYYELLTHRREQKIADTAIIRIEQLYPFPYDELKAQIARYNNVKRVVWCQEEPKNQGAWFCTRDRLAKSLPAQIQLTCVSRKPMAAPASGYPAYYKKTQKEVILGAYQ